MPFACPNPSCRSVYNVSPKQAGTRFVCQSCGLALVIEADGLKLDDSPARAGQEPAANAPAPMTSAERFPWLARVPRVGGLHRLGEMIASDPHTWLFGAGAVLVIIFLFFPLLDQAKIAGRTAPITAGDRRQDRLDQELEKKKKGKEDSKLDAEERERKKARDEWERTKQELMVGVDEAQQSFRAANYWYLWGMLFGFLCLALASLGFLTPQQTPSRRIVGGVVICGQMLLIFFAFVIVSIVSTR